ncbi:MAG: hypothetical protein HY544_01865 [Candidatus Diapherotrites archaeon]|uniref:cGAS/DncV-like nucleotidyltransferase C-terminal helical domain-containing protein n=1 Tax=Candidatus Iainarchaeum sp. TaxID=3101447 RepID=A0A8T3YI70_9ARCH|nr:hypothetical protein [Candidatus Diapherotrites archaeon]
MTLSEQQLETWGHTGADSGSARTYDTVKNIINNSAYAKKNELSIFLQGSYANTTHVRANSDVDIVVMLKSVWTSDKTKLTEPEKTTYSTKTSTSAYSHSELRNDLTNLFGNRVTGSGNKSIKLNLGNGYLNADVIPCLSHRVYHSFSEANQAHYTEGVSIKKPDGSLIYNFPKQHIDNGVKKHQSTGDLYKKVVRIFKNARNKLVDEGKLNNRVAPSYFVECLLYNAPNSCYTTSLQTSVFNCLKWLNENTENLNSFNCQNGITRLFGQEETQWNATDCKAFIGACIQLWNGE